MTSTFTQAGPSLMALRSMSPRKLRALLADGHPVVPSSLDDSEYRGISLGLPAWVERLAWTTFMKTFHRDPDTGALRGWNVRLKQTGLEGPVEPMRTPSGAPTTFGHYHVVDPDPDAMPRGCAGGLLIDYDRGGNSRFDGVRLVRDPLVALEAGSSTRLLGASYLQLGFRIMTPAYFVLERFGPLEHVAHPPGRPGA